jgi:hypothetical protein
MCRAGAVVCSAHVRRLSESGGLTTGTTGPRPRFRSAPAPLGHRLIPGLRCQACFLRGGRPITGKTLPTQPRRQRLRRNAGVGPGTSRRAANRRRRARGDGNVSPSPPGPSRVSPGGNGGWRVPHSADRSLRPQGLADGPRARVKIYRCMGGQTHPSQTRPRLRPWTRHHTIEPGGTIMV